MNCIIREGQRVLGILGTGIDLTAFIQEVVNIPQPGITSIFVDRQGAVQAHRDQNLVDLTSLAVEMRAKRTVFSSLDVPADRTRLRALMDEVATGKSLVTSSFMQIGGKQMLVGIGYLDELGWFNVTLMDIDTIIDKRLFVPIGALLALVMGLVAVVLVMVFNRQVLDRLKQLEGAVRSALKGDYEPVRSMKDPRLDEIGRLTSAFSAMAATVSDNINQLETRVLQRTKELQQLAFRDAQTGIPNRRGFIDAFSNAAPHQRRGLLLLDIDNFKTINDNFGHAGGDAVILAIADRLSGAIGQDIICGRWGGDEFIVLLSHTAPHVLQAAAYSVRAAITDRPVDLPNGRSCQVTVSVGACIVEPGNSIDVATDMADTGLYAAKNEGLNRITLFQPATSEETKRSNFEAPGREARSSERQR